MKEKCLKISIFLFLSFNKILPHPATYAWQLQIQPRHQKRGGKWGEMGILCISFHVCCTPIPTSQLCCSLPANINFPWQSPTAPNHALLNPAGASLWNKHRGPVLKSIKLKSSHFWALPFIYTEPRGFKVFQGGFEGRGLVLFWPHNKICSSKSFVGSSHAFISWFIVKQDWVSSTSFHPLLCFLLLISPSHLFRHAPISPQAVYFKYPLVFSLTTYPPLFSNLFPYSSTVQ